MMTWNLRGKPLESLQESWDLLEAQGVDFLFLQELGGRGGSRSLGSDPLHLGKKGVRGVCWPSASTVSSTGCLYS